MVISQQRPCALTKYRVAQVAYPRRRCHRAKRSGSSKGGKELCEACSSCAREAHTSRERRRRDELKRRGDHLRGDVVRAWPPLAIGDEKVVPVTLNPIDRHRMPAGRTRTKEDTDHHRLGEIHGRRGRSLRRRLKLKRAPLLRIPDHH